MVSGQPETDEEREARFATLRQALEKITLPEEVDSRARLTSIDAMAGAGTSRTTRHSKARLAEKSARLAAPAAEPTVQRDCYSPVPLNGERVATRCHLSIFHSMENCPSGRQPGFSFMRRAGLAAAPDWGGARTRS
jgi:hypothetical protein